MTTIEDELKKAQNLMRGSIKISEKIVNKSHTSDSDKIKEIRAYSMANTLATEAVYYQNQAIIEQNKRIIKYLEDRKK